MTINWMECQLGKWELDEIAFEQNDNLMKCQFGKMEDMKIR